MKAAAGNVVKKVMSVRVGESTFGILTKQEPYANG